MTESTQHPVSALRERIELMWLDDATASQQEALLSSEGRALSMSFVELGDQYAEQLKGAALTDEARVVAQFYTFDWPEHAKRYLLLLRRILLEWERAAVLQAEGHTEAQNLRVLAKASKAALLRAADDWQKTIDDALAHWRTNAEARAVILYEHSLQNNPWPTYKSQLLELYEQFAHLHTDFETRVEAAHTLARLIGELDQVPRLLGDSLDELEARARRALELINAADDDEASRQLPAALEALEPTEVVGNFAESLASDANSIIDRLPDDARLFVADNSGQLRYRDIPLERRVGQWVSAEAMPTLLQAGRSSEQLAADLARSLLDSRNRITLARDWSEAAATSRTLLAPDVSEDVEETSEHRADRLAADSSFTQPLEGFLDRLQKSRDRLEQSTDATLRKVDEELRLSRVYDPEKGFLEVSFEAGVSQMLHTQDALLSRFTTWLAEQRRNLRRLRLRVSEEENLSEGERVVRVLRTRRVDPRNAAYTSVIVTRGFVGEAFHAGRESEIERVRLAIAAGREGFRGAVAVTGQRYCGKTHFVELIAGRYFEQRAVRLRPFAVLEVAGRTMQTTCDLREALTFLRKHSVGTRVLVLLDDLELWASPSVSLAANAEALRDALDTLSGRLFFMVTMGNWTFKRLSSGLGLSAAFQVEVNLDTMQMDAFQQTVLTRHAATHHVLVDGSGEELTERKMLDHAEDVYRAARGNVGDALRRWAQSVKRSGVTEVTLAPKSNHQLPNFIDADNGVVLATVKRLRYVNEYDLRKLFGPAFDQQYRAVVQRLLRLEVLTRHRSGTLSINPVVSNEVARLLERDGYLQANYSRNPILLT